MADTTPPPTRRRWPRRLAVGVVVLVVLAVAIPFAYIHLIEGSSPPKLALKPTTETTTAAGPLDLAGAWHVGSGSLVGYRVNEVLVGQHTTAVGRTSDVTGQLTFTATALTAATFTTEMATVKSDQSGRDSQFRGSIMDTSTYPTSTFTLTGPVAVGSGLTTGAVQSEQVSGQLQLRGQTHPVTFTLSAVHSGSGIDVQGEIPITFATWGIKAPDLGFVTAEDHGILEFLLHLVPGSSSGSSSSGGSSSGSGSSSGGGSGSGSGGGGFGGGGPGGPPPGGGPGGGGGSGGGPGISVPATTTPTLTLPAG